MSTLKIENGFVYRFCEDGWIQCCLAEGVDADDNIRPLSITWANYRAVVLLSDGTFQTTEDGIVFWRGLTDDSKECV